MPQLLGEEEPTITPTPEGFRGAFPKPSQSDDKDAKTTSDPGETAAKSKPRPRPKTIREIELALNANWREVGDETKKLLGHQRDQLENKTGMEVAVLAL